MCPFLTRHQTKEDTSQQQLHPVKQCHFVTIGMLKKNVHCIKIELNTYMYIHTSWMVHGKDNKIVNCMCLNTDHRREWMSTYVFIIELHKNKMAWQAWWPFVHRNNMTNVLAHQSQNAVVTSMWLTHYCSRPLFLWTTCHRMACKPGA